jgi:hypothetical protein
VGGSAVRASGGWPDIIGVTDTGAGFGLVRYTVAVSWLLGVVSSDVAVPGLLGVVGSNVTMSGSLSVLGEGWLGGGRPCGGRNPSTGTAERDLEGAGESLDGGVTSFAMDSGVEKTAALIYDQSRIFSKAGNSQGIDHLLGKREHKLVAKVSEG